MNTVKLGKEEATVTLTKDDLHLINNALNEISNGINIADSEFHTRVGADRAEARALLARVNTLLKSLRG